LLPVAKQIGDYQQRFAEAGFRDPKRDQPLWSEYLVERSVVVPGGRESWEKIDMKAVLKRAQKEWSAVQGEQLPPGFLLAADQNPGAGAVGYCAPLPQLAGDAWGTESMHPWFVEQAKKFIADQAAAVMDAIAAIPVPRRTVDISVAVPDPAVASEVAVRLPTWGVPVTALPGRSAADGSLGMLLAATAEWLASNGCDELCTLVRHPDIERYLEQRGVREVCVVALHRLHVHRVVVGGQQLFDNAFDVP
jgi:hypothetical protein